MIKHLKQRIAKEEFYPGWLSFLTSPYYITRSHLIDSIRSAAPDIKGSVLDFGCGSKPYKSLFTSATSYVGVDVEVSGHDHAASNVDVFYKDGILPFDDASFDNVVSFEVFEHVINLEEMLPEIARVVRSGGTMLVTVPFIYPEHEMPYDFRRLSVNGIKNLLETHGFELIDARRYPTALLSISQLLNHFVFTRLCRRGTLVKAIAHVALCLPLQVAAYVFRGKPQDSDTYLGSMTLFRKK